MRDAKIVSRKFDIPGSHTLQAVLPYGAYSSLSRGFFM
jgi:hypothetical protein